MAIEDVKPAKSEVSFWAGILLADHLPTPQILLNPFFNPFINFVAFLARNFTKVPGGPAIFDFKAVLPYVVATVFTGANKPPIPGIKQRIKSIIA